MASRCAVLDTGMAPARWNLAFDQALVEAHRQRRQGDTIRFIRFPRAAIVGRHQCLAREVDVAWCEVHGVELARRITGGGAIWMEPDILGWELVLSRHGVAADLAAVGARIGEAVARALVGLGVRARFRPRNDVEVDGRKLCGMGGLFDGDTLLYQGTVLVDADLEAMSRALVLPAAKLERRGLSLLTERLTSLRLLLGEAPALGTVQTGLLEAWAKALSLAPERCPVPPELMVAAQTIQDGEIGTDAFVAGLPPPSGEPWRSGEHRAAGGTIRAHLRLRPSQDAVIQDVWFEGDFFVSPPRVVTGLEAALKDLPLTCAADAVEAFFSRHPGVTMLGLAPDDFVAALAAAR